MLKNSENIDVENDTTQKVSKIVGTLAIAIRIIGSAVAIVMLLAVAMKYMLAAPGDKADIKKSATIYVVGAIILFATTNILGLIYKFSTVIKA